MVVSKMADKQLVEKLISARNAVKRKFQELQSDIVHHENYLEKKFKPIADPIKELLQNIKHEKVDVKPEPVSIKNEHPFVSSTPNKEKSETAKSDVEKLNITSSVKHRRVRDLTSIPQRRISFEESIVEPPVDSDDEFAHIKPEEEMKELEKSAAFQDYISDYGGNAKTYISGLRLDVKKEYDYNYGPKIDIRKDGEGNEYDTGNYMLGNSVIDFSDDGKVIYITTPDNVKHPYKGSVALYELIFKGVPNKAIVQKDVQAVKDYKDILERTNVHRVKFVPDGALRSNVGQKYLDYIKPILNMNFKTTALRESPTAPKPTKSTRSRAQTLPSSSKDISKVINKSKVGKGILKLNNKAVQYVPYKNANNLVNRLKLLIGAKSAGNNSHDNEITYIIDELKSIKVIK